MNIIRKQPNESGAYPPIQSWDRVYAPEKFYKSLTELNYPAEALEH